MKGEAWNFGAIILSVCLTASSQLIVRAGMLHTSLAAEMTKSSSAWEKISLLIWSPYIVAGLLLFGLSAGTWLVVLSRTPVSLAYPFVGLGIVLTTLGGWFLLGEAVSGSRLLAIGIILLGLILLGASK